MLSWAFLPHHRGCWARPPPGTQEATQTGVWRGVAGRCSQAHLVCIPLAEPWAVRFLPGALVAGVGQSFSPYPSC